MLRLATAVSPTESAKEAGLRYIMDDRPGITRRKRGKNFVYIQPSGGPVRDPDDLGRIKRLAIPPAWTDVWISPVANGHLQATGNDARRRKQYRYHAYWRQVRDENKYGRVMAFGRALPLIRQRVAKDMARQGLPREKVLATVVKLLEATLIRVGNEEYARANQSFGLTTLRDHHAKISGDTVTFQFRGKSGKMHKIDVRDRHLARTVKRCQDLPGQEIFAYLDEDGQWQDVKSQDVNAYLRDITGESFTAKDFRTWSGTVLAAIALREVEHFTSQKQAKSNIVKAIEGVAKLLGNTPSICRKCYVHPEVLESYLQGTTIRSIRQRSERAAAKLKPDEAAVMALLAARLKAGKKGKPTPPAKVAAALAKSVKRIKGAR